MTFEETGLENLTIEFEALQEIMEAAGFDYAYDYERATFDLKIIDQVHDDVFYFRVPAYIEKGEIPSPNAIVKLMTPYLGKHYYPHGVEYDEEFPKHVKDKCLKKLKSVTEKIKAEAK